MLELATIVVNVENAGLNQDFIVEASELARWDQGIYDLMALWIDAATDPSERDEIVADIPGITRRLS